MASQVAHIVYAQKFFQKLERGGFEGEKGGPQKPKLPSDLDRDQFFLGAVFPDSRRIDPEIKRSQTHLVFSPLDLDFYGLSSFEAGWKFHLFCDMRREEVLNQKKFYALSGASDLAGLPAKLLEDVLIYPEYENWEKISAFFNNPPFPTDSLPVEKETFFLWYAILAKYLEVRPQEKSIRAFISKLPRLSSRVDEIMESFSLLEKNKKAVEILKAVQDEIV